MTDDGSYGEKGVVTAPLEKKIVEGANFDEVITIGPLIMMKFVVKTTKPHNVKTVVSMNPIMVDGTGMCGGCRLTVVGRPSLPAWTVPTLTALRSILTRLCTAARCTSPLRPTPARPSAIC